MTDREPAAIGDALARETLDTGPYVYGFAHDVWFEPRITPLTLAGTDRPGGIHFDLTAWDGPWWDHALVRIWESPAWAVPRDVPDTAELVEGIFGSLGRPRVTRDDPVTEQFPAVEEASWPAFEPLPSESPTV